MMIISEKRHRLDKDPIPGKTAFIFTGQGSQYSGMGEGLFESSPAARSIFLTAGAVMDEIDFLHLIFHGAEDVLNNTEYAQPAIVAVSLAHLASYKEAYGDRALFPAIVAGHSLGEITAGAAAGLYDESTAIKLAAKRGKIMAERGTGTMAVVGEVDESNLEQICQSVSNEKNGIVVVSNYNSPKQLVISGNVLAVEDAVRVARSKGIKAKKLAVSVASHSPLMADAHLAFQEVLDNFRFNVPKIPIVLNITGELTRDPERIKEGFVSALDNPVQWVKVVKTMWDNGVTNIIEFGPKEVLTRLVGEIESRIATSRE